MTFCSIFKAESLNLDLLCQISLRLPIHKRTYLYIERER